MSKSKAVSPWTPLTYHGWWRRSSVDGIEFNCYQTIRGYWIHSFLYGAPFNSASEAMGDMDRRLREQGYELCSDEQWAKIQVLL
jgi:hypothetical protein